MLRFCSSLAGPTLVYYRKSRTTFRLFKLFTVKKKRHRVYVTTSRMKSSLVPYYSQVDWEVHVSLLTICPFHVDGYGRWLTL